MGHPSQGAIYQILHSCVAELVRAGLVGQDCQSLLSYRELQLVGLERSPASQAGLQLWEAAGAAAGLSGRTLRKVESVLKLPSMYNIIEFRLKKRKS